MINHALAIRYAKALFEVDREKEHLKETLRHFDFIIGLIQSDLKLKKFLISPQISLEEKRSMLKSYAECRISESFSRFLVYILEKKRWSYLPQIAAEYRLMVDDYLKIWEAKIVVAVPIGPHEEKRLKDKLENFYRKKIEIKTEIDPKIIGGAILIFANEMIDWSIKTRLKKIKEKLLTTTV